MALKPALDRFYDGIGNVVLRDENGNPSIFVRHPKVNSSFLDTRLPDTPHPAFVVGENVDDAVLIGKYPNSSLKDNGTLYSLPNSPISLTDSDSTYLNVKSRIEAFNSTATHMTVADHGLFVLLGHKYGDEGMRGVQGECVDTHDVDVIWKNGNAVGNGDVGKLYGFEGWAYQALQAHTMSFDKAPNIAPQYWKKIKKVGGTPNYVNPTYSYDTTNRTYNSALSGSGPLSYYMLCDRTLESDIISLNSVYIAGVRIYHSELQIIPNNLAALSSTDISDNSSEWRAILPHENDSGCDYVTPGTTGTIHYCWNNSKITIVGREPEESELSDSISRSTKFSEIATEVTTVPVMPTIMYELGLAPLPGTKVRGKWVGFRIGASTIQHLLAFSFHYGDPEAYGLAYMTDFKYQSELKITSRTRVRVPTI